MRSEHVMINGKAYIRYDGPHDELVGIVRKGDLVTLLWQNDDDQSESIKITGTVTKHDPNHVTISCFGEEMRYTLKYSSVIAFMKYVVTNIRRPVDNMLPDSPGLWSDKSHDTWIVDDNLNAQLISYGRGWMIGAEEYSPSEYAGYAPFTKLTITEEGISS